MRIRLTKINGDKLIKVISTKGNSAEPYVDGAPMEAVYPRVPTVGFPYGVYNERVSFRTSPVTEILTTVTFRTENSIYQWQIIG